MTTPLASLDTCKTCGGAIYKDPVNAMWYPSPLVRHGDEGPECHDGLHEPTSDHHA